MEALARIRQLGGPHQDKAAMEILTRIGGPHQVKAAMATQTRLWWASQNFFSGRTLLIACVKFQNSDLLMFLLHCKS